MKETGRILFFFYLIDTKNVRISRKKSETIHQEIFKERIKDMIFEKKNKENSREIGEHISQDTRKIFERLSWNQSLSMIFEKLSSWKRSILSIFVER